MLKSYPLSTLFPAAQQHRLSSSSACNIFYHVSVGSVFLLSFFSPVPPKWLYFFGCSDFPVYICLESLQALLLNGTDEMRMKLHGLQACSAARYVIVEGVADQTSVLGLTSWRHMLLW